MREFIIYTDGGYSVSNNVGSGAYIVLEADGQTPVKQDSFVLWRETSQRVEIKAILAALYALPNGCRAQIITDNKNAANGLGHIPKRKGKPDIDLLIQYRQMVKKKHLEIEFKWVPSHKGDAWNERCDSLCTETLAQAEANRRKIEVVAAIIKKEDKVFATQRGHGSLKDRWEFPGGKIEAGETPKAALKREIREELSTDIRIGKLLTTVEWDYPDFHLTMHCFLCTLTSDSLRLNEHESARWLSYTDLRDVQWLPADEDILPHIAADLLQIDQELSEYIETQIIPRYTHFDRAHQQDHARAVIARALDLAKHYELNRNMLYTAAACHDLGLAVDRNTHHLESGRLIREDRELTLWFTREEIETIAQAAEDHRASAKSEPRSIYGRIVAEADRLIEPEQIIRRTIQYGLAHYPSLPEEGHWERTLEHLHEKYADGGYLKLWIPQSPNAAKLESLRAIIRDEKSLRAIFDRIYREETVRPS